MCPGPAVSHYSKQRDVIKCYLLSVSNSDKVFKLKSLNLKPGTKLQNQGSNVTLLYRFWYSIKCWPGLWGGTQISASGPSSRHLKVLGSGSGFDQLQIKNHMRFICTNHLPSKLCLLYGNPIFKLRLHHPKKHSAPQPWVWRMCKITDMHNFTQLT